MPTTASDWMLRTNRRRARLWSSRSNTFSSIMRKATDQREHIAFPSAMNNLEVFRWLLDVQPIWPIDETQATPLTAREATAQWANGKEAQHALNLLTTEERAKVLRFYRPNDAKLSLGSCLLKHRAITSKCEVSWSEVVISEDSNRKPCYKPPKPDGQPLEFNVSHHGTLVALVGCRGNEVKLGVDIVRMNWDKDYATVMREGFQAWANTYEAVFSEREIKDIADYVAPKHVDPQEMIRSKLRHFYAHWCLKEAYVKMTGEALSASWLKDLEFRNVQVPSPSAQKANDWGQTCGNVEIWFHGNRVNDVQLEIQAFRDDYMIATASSSVDFSLSAFKELDLEKDVYP